MILALDPGTTQTAWCFYDRDTTLAGIDANDYVVELVKRSSADLLAIEMVASYGMPVGAEIFKTVFWSGRFAQASSMKWELVYRKDVKMHLCGTMRAKDGNIRQALIDRFGKPGTKKAPGRLYGFHDDMWAALGVAVTAFDRRRPA